MTTTMSQKPMHRRATKNLKSPTKNLKSPAKNLKSPTKNLKSPAKNLKSPTKNLKSRHPHQLPLAHRQSVRKYCVRSKRADGFDTWSVLFLEQQPWPRRLLLRISRQNSYGYLLALPFIIYAIARISSTGGSRVATESKRPRWTASFSIA